MYAGCKEKKFFLGYNCYEGGYINGSFENGDVFSHSHELTVDGLKEQGCEPDYSQGWSAEAYDRDLSFDAEEGTIHYFCPCRCK